MSHEVPLPTGGSRGAAGVIAPPPLIYLGGLAIGLVFDAAMPEATVGSAVAVPLGLALLLAGGSLMRAFVRELHRARTAVRPGRATTALVTTGPYRFTRNPGYLGMANVFAGVVLLVGAPWALVALVPTLVVVDRGVIAREERYLGALFGTEYDAYRSRVRRWI